MLIKNIRLFNYKNHESAHFEFEQGLNCLTGKNGSGKTNVLDAIYFLCLTKSYFSTAELDCLMHDEQVCTVKAQFDSDRSHEVFFSLSPSKKKVFKCDDKPYPRISDHIGRLPVILIEPHDTDYIRMGSELRRKLFDGMISQVDSHYLEHLVVYNKHLRQRNRLLKGEEGPAPDPELLDIYDEALLTAGRYIFDKRRSFSEAFTPGLQDIYGKLAGMSEPVTLNHISEYDGGSFEERFKANRSQDIYAGRTLLGIHRDDFEFLIGEERKSVKQYASQGQQKSFILALKLNQIPLFSDQLGTSPLLLLDDIFDKLDTGRICRLLEMIDTWGLQAVLTDARRERTEGLVREMKLESHIIDLEA